MSRGISKLSGLSCSRRVELLCDYLDRELPPAERKAIAGHRRSCRPCAELLASLARTVETLRQLRRAKAPASARRALRAAVAISASGSAARRRA